MTVAQRVWLELRCWWHAFREHMSLDSAPAGTQTWSDRPSVLVNCSCGGYAQVQFLDDWPEMSRGMLVEEATCPLMIRYQWRHQRRLPAVRTTTPIHKETK